jgi:ubiquinone/menaquinone biosynthesis C-methylase UbiE
MNLKQLRANWTAFGERDPLWAILTVPGKERGGWETEEFFRTGQREIADVMDYVSRLHPVARRRALDFGCGVGRLAQALAEHFEEVAGVDIAPSMLELARRHNRHGERCRYHLNSRPNLAIFAGNSFDFIYSSITLQHMEPRYSRRYLGEFVRVLAPGGVLVFQLPGEPLAQGARLVQRLVPARVLGVYRRFYYRWRYRGQPVMELYGIPQPAVSRLLERAGARILDITADDAPGKTWSSFRYCAVKPGC